jgi:PAS domain S-box-containing protein
MSFDQLLVRGLAALCTCCLALFFTASSISGEFAPAARVGYFGVYLTGAAACLAASRAVRAHILRWQWLSPAIVSIPVAIVAGRWSATASDLFALLFYPFAMLTAAQPSRRRLSAVWTYEPVDVLMVSGAALTALLFLWVRGLPDPSLYRLLAPAAAVSLVLPVMIEAVRGRQRQPHAGIGFFLAGLLLAVLTDVTPATIPFSAFTWAGAVWLMGVGAAVAAAGRSFVDTSADRRPLLPTGWWPVAAVAGVYALIGVQLRRVESQDVRLLLAGGTLLTALIVVRQFMALRRNDDLLQARLADEARFRALVQQSPDAFLILDAAGRIAYHSPAFPELIRGAAADCVGRRLVDLLAREVEPTVAATLSYVAQTAGRSYRTPVSIPGTDNRTREIELVATNRTDEPAIAGIVLAMRDITERVQFERQLARQDKMDAVDRMTSGVAHEFNNLLTVILGNVDLLCAHAKPDADAGEGLDEIRCAVTKAAELSRSLLGVSRRRSLTGSPLDLNTLVPRIERMLRSGMGPEYSIVLRMAPDLWPAHADVEDFEHVLLNLALNARDAMPGGGMLTIGGRNVPSAELPSPTAMPRQDYVRLTVEDTGVGMPKDVMARAFEPFFSTKTEGQGTGLGLAFVYAALRRMGGFVEVSSTVGMGTTFTLWLPRAGQPTRVRGFEVTPYRPS